MKILIGFATLTGNTELVAAEIAEVLSKEGHSVELIEFYELTLEKLRQADLVFLGESSWGDGNHNPIGEELEIQIIDEDWDLSLVKVALFGLGEKIYDNFCGAIDKLGELLVKRNANKLGETLKIDGYPDDEILIDARDWAKSIISDH